MSLIVLMTVQRFTNVMAALRGSKSVLPYNQLRLFLVLADERLKEAGGEFDAVQSSKIAFQVLNSIALGIGNLDPPNKPTAIPSSSMAALCQSFARCHRKLIDLLEHKISILNETQGGGGSMAGPIIREWNQYGSAIDDDSTELYAIGLPKTKVNAIASIADDAKEEMVEQERY